MDLPTCPPCSPPRTPGYVSLWRGKLPVEGCDPHSDLETEPAGSPDSTSPAPAPYLSTLGSWDPVPKGAVCPGASLVTKWDLCIPGLPT